MRITVKLIPALLLGSTLSACSMAGTGDFFADEYGQTHNHYNNTSCWQPEVVSQPHIIAQPAQNRCGQTNYIQPNFVPNYGQPVAPQPTYVQRPLVQAPVLQAPVVQAPIAPPTYVYPGQVHGAYVPPTYGAHPHGLRGRKNRSKGHFYGTLGGVNYELGEDIYGVQGRLGYQLNSFLGAEAEGSFGTIDDTDPLTLTGGAIVDQKVNIDTSLAGFGVVRYPLFGKLSGLSRVGYHTSEVDVEVTDAAGTSVQQDFTTDGFAYGTGLEYAFSPKTALRVDYTIYDFDGPDAEAVSVALSRKF